MRSAPILAAMLCVSAPLAAQDEAEAEAGYADIDEGPIFDAVEAFLAAIGSEDRTELAAQMVPEGTIFVHNLMDPENPRVDVVPVAKHLENWTQRSGKYEETMDEYELSVSWTMAHAWGRYTFKVDGEVSHCGVNSLSLVQTDGGQWKVGNASFTMVAPDECQRRADTRAMVDETLAAADLAASLESNPPELSPDELPSDYSIGRCLLEVDGEAYISGPCAFNRREDGGFMFNGPSQAYEGIHYPDNALPMGISTDYFVYLMHYEDDIDEETGQGWYASWNEDKRSTKADAYLGAVKRDGDCYSNARTRICLWES